VPIVNILSTTYPLGAQKKKHKHQHKHTHKPSQPSKKQDEYYAGLLRRPSPAQEGAGLVRKSAAARGAVSIFFPVTNPPPKFFESTLTQPVFVP
jgi:hypothetical protein